MQIHGILVLSIVQVVIRAAGAVVDNAMLTGPGATATNEPETKLDQPFRLSVLVEPCPATFVSGYSNRFSALLQHLQRAKAEAHIITAELQVKDRPQSWLGFPIHYTSGVRLPCYPLISLSLDYTCKAIRTVATYRPHLIHATSPGLIVFSAILASRMFQVPLIISYHTHLPVYIRSYLPVPRCVSRWLEWLSWQLIRVVHSFADLTIVTSPQIHEEFRRHGVTRLDVWQKGIDTEHFHPRNYNDSMRRRMSGGRPEQLLIVYIGRLASEKRLRDLKGILDLLPEACLCLVGGGPQEAELKEFFHGTRTVFTGMLVGEELQQAFASGDVFCMTSDSETLGFVVLESLASGVPVVGAAAGGLLDLIDDGVTGYLVTPGNATEFANRIRLLRDPQVRAQYAIQARKETEKWSWEQSMTRLMSVQYNVAMANFDDRIEQRLRRFLLRTKDGYFSKLQPLN